MALFLRFVSVKCAVRTISCVKRFYSTSHSSTFLEGLGIRYFIPRTTNTRADIQTEQTKGPGDSLPKEFKVIYSFPGERVLEGMTWAVLAFAALFIYVVYDPNCFKKSYERLKEEENEAILEEPVMGENRTPSGIVAEIDKITQSILEDRFFATDQRLKSLYGLALMIILLYCRSRCVLNIYRHNNEYVAVFYQAFGLRKKLIKHMASDVCYSPKKILFQYNLMGRNVIIFPNSFVDYNEKQIYMQSKNL